MPNSTTAQLLVREKLSKAKFLVLFFYRGCYCQNCRQYLTHANPQAQEFRALGGDVIGVCSQQEEVVRAVQVTCSTNFTLLSDQKNSLAKEYNVSITKKPEEGTAGAVITSQGILFRWLGTQGKNSKDQSHNMRPEDVLTIVKFYFSPQFLRFRSLENKDCAFKAVYESPRLRQVFRKYLESELNDDALDFIEAVDELKVKMVKYERKPRKVAEEVHGLVQTFIKEDSRKAVNLPNEARSRVIDTAAELSYKPSNQDLKELASALGIAYEQVMASLKLDSFRRFICHPSFVHVVEATPQHFYVKAM